MYFATMESMIQKVIVALSMAPGLGTQAYTEDIVAQSIKDAYVVLSQQQFWNKQCRWESRTLDGSTGVVTTALPFRSFSDIDRVLHGTSLRPLRMLPLEANPFSLSGTTPRYIENYDASDDGDRLFRVWPLTATGNVRVRGRVLLDPDDIGPETTVNFDEQALRFYACWEIAEGDAASPGQTSRFQGLFARRMQQLVIAEAQHPIELDPRHYEDVNDWHEEP